ncbi:chalcone isomerase family protein [Aquabacterium sp. A7-Y]|uniref:chalcone isomerase family protein n=1 Tax=Aquabacterium sp. A7-Y TaxID=1349605 RepID=UPI00223CB058|nr:chalcone isomerase family protein [Aquabacterium sp. A7-Y]MCW7541652.1 chalcone isomerase family protein [Aquabacterium sp. A7-Y]
MLFTSCSPLAVVRSCTAALLVLAACGTRAAEPTTAPAAGPAKVELEGVLFDETVLHGGQVLPLNGVGLSSILSARSMVVALYLPSKQKTIEGALNVKGPKRIHYCTIRTISTRDLANAMLDRIRQNTTTEEFSANIVQTAQLGAVFGTRKEVRKGDCALIDWMPATQSTEFRLNGELLEQPIKGESFFQMMMKVWIGPNVRASTREALLGLR